VTVTVNAVNEPPIAVNDRATTLEDTPVTVAILANDSNPDGGPLTIVSATAPNGTVVLNPNGTITYIPNANFNGTDTITYRVSDGQGGFANATVTVTVTPVNDAPVDRGEVATTIGGSSITVPVLTNASDVDGDKLSVISATPSVGVAVINADGSITYTPPPEFDGVATITYVVSDGNGGFVTSIITVNVTQANADISQLLGFADPNFPDFGRIATTRADQSEFINTPLIILDTVNSFRSLNGMTDLNVQSPLLAAVNSIQSLGGNRTLDVNGSPISDVVGQIEDRIDFRFGADKLFDKRFGDFGVKGLTGFSVRQLGTENDQVMIESVVRDRAIYMEMRDIGADSDPRIVEHQIRMRDGSALPEWIHFDKRGLAIIERPADMDEVHLIVRSIRADGKVIETPVVIQGATGEIQLDKPLKTSSIDTLNQSFAAVHGAALIEAQRLAASFNG
jgi:hypothetical protein